MAPGYFECLPGQLTGGHTPPHGSHSPGLLVKGIEPLLRHGGGLLPVREEVGLLLLPVLEEGGLLLPVLEEDGLLLLPVGRHCVEEGGGHQERKEPMVQGRHGPGL